MKPIRLRSHLLIYLTFLTIALSTIFVFLFTSFYSEKAMDDLTEYGKSIAQNTAFISADFLITEDYAPLQEFIEEFSKRPKVEDICIADRHGSIISSLDVSRFGETMSGLHEEWVNAKEAPATLVVGKKEQTLIVMTPISLEGMFLGYTRLTLSMAEVKKTVTAVRKQGTIIGLSACLVTIIFCLLIANMLNKPLQRLLKRTNRIKAGDFKPEDFKEQKVLEIGEFSQALTVMAEAIGVREQALQKMVANLDNLPSPVFSIDSDFRITYINPVGAASACLPLDECIGQKCADIFKTPICNTQQCPMHLALAKDQVVNGETSINSSHKSIPVKYTSIAFRDKTGAFSNGLESFIDISDLYQALATSERQNRLRSAQVNIHDRLRGDQDENILCDKLLSGLADHITFQAGTIYLADDTKKLILKASYAGRHIITNVPVFSFGEGITGQAASDKKPIIISKIPKDYTPVFSGIGESSPRHILAMPLLFEEKVIGVIELASFIEFDDFTLDLLKDVLKNAAIVINMAQSRLKVSKLLAKTKQQAEMLQSQQEEMQSSNEELREQTEALLHSEHQLQQQAEELQSQQEELQITNEELAERTDTLEQQQEVVVNKNRELGLQHNELLRKTTELENTNRYKSEFLANMSHELRTPLNSILILSQLFATNRENNLSDKQIEFAQTINNSGSDLLKLINEVLDLAKIEAGRVQIDIAPLDLADFLTDMQLSFSQVAAEQGLTLLTELNDNVPATISTDSQKLLQIIKNLLSNAIKFTQEGAVRLHIHRPEPGSDCGQLSADECVAFSVIDNGIGIALDKQELIFEAFQQVDGSISRKYGGTGLGLSIAREFATTLGGEIKITSSPGKGSTFTILLPETLENYPFEPPKETDIKEEVEPVVIPDQESYHTKNEPTDQKIAIDEEVSDDRKNLTQNDKILLIIEDDQTFVQVLIDLAHERGFKCIIAEDGESGIHYADYYHPGAIILDIGLPGINGWQVMEKLKHNPTTCHIPVHFLSASDESVQARKQGAIGFLTKPVSVEKLQETLTILEDEIKRTVRNLLIVEDHNDQRTSMVELITSPNINIQAVATGNEALQLLENNSFDCMILDLGLQDMEGHKLLEMIKNNARLSNLPIIIYTGRELNKEEEEKLRRYSDSIIIKGVQSPERLLAETTLFLHQIEKQMPEDKRQMLASVYQRENIFTNKKVLVVDDDMRNVFALSSALEEKGMEVLAAEDGLKALKVLEENPDLNVILMDIMMPEMDGFEAMSRIRAQPAFNNLPIIALTAKAMKGDRHKCIEAGANDYLAKPVDIERLLSMLRVWLCQ